MDELSGSIVPLVTPFLMDEKIDFAGLKKLLNFHECASTTALIIAGSTGEGTLLSMDEREKLIEYVVKNSELPIWVGVSALNYDHAMRLITQASECGADGVMVTAPLYVRANQQGLLSYFSKLADASDLEVLLYNHPERTGSVIEVETACILSEHSNIIGIKDTLIHEERMQAYQQAGTDFSVLCGDDRQIMMCLANGGSGAISVIGNLLPELVQTVCLLSSKQLFKKASSITLRWQPLVEVLSYSNPSAIKYAMYKQGLIEAIVKPPLTGLSEYQKTKVDEILVNLQPLLNLNPDF
jgi:4-hydroxy-tetrahydrodipicolinate synthase